MLEFEVTGDRNNFTDLQTIYLEMKYKVVQSSGADLKYVGAAVADTTRTDAHFFQEICCTQFSWTVKCQRTV